MRRPPFRVEEPDLGDRNRSEESDAVLVPATEAMAEVKLAHDMTAFREAAAEAAVRPALTNQRYGSQDCHVEPLLGAPKQERFNTGRIE